MIFFFFSIPNIAIYMRQVLGPVFVIYNIKSLVVELQKTDENFDIFKRSFTFLAFFTSILAGTVQNFQKGIKSSLSIRMVTYFGQISPNFAFLLIYQEGANRKDWSK